VRHLIRSHRPHPIAATLLAGGLSTFLVGPEPLADPPSPPASFGSDHRAAVIDSVAGALERVYVFEDVAHEMVAHVRAELAAGAYDDLEDPGAFTHRLTQDLRSISHDRHLGVGPLPPQSIQEQEEDPEVVAERQRRRLARGNYGFDRVEILDGNIGYVKFDGFVDASLGGETAVAAMNFVANCDALIFDLRENGGGSPSMIQLLTSYLLDEPTHINSFYVRSTDTEEQFWTHAHVEGPRLVDVPVYVLTSSYTFSAAEEFSYNLRTLERATLVGETTGGGAHPVQSHAFPDLGVQARVPYGRAVNPITGTNWERVGVEPHLAVAADEALLVARVDALETLEAASTDDAHRQQLAWVREGIEIERGPIELGDIDLTAYVGQYGVRRVTLENGRLYYQREGRPRFTLRPVGEHLFFLEGEDHFRIRFEPDGEGGMARLVGLYSNGNTDASERTEDGSGETG